MSALALLLSIYLAQTGPVKPSGATGLTIVPEDFLRRWDSVTFFFPEPLGPNKNIHEDHPEKFVKMSPAHPGAFSWINSQILVFKPSEPWPALQRFTFTVRGKAWRRSTLMSAPIELSPADEETGLEPIESISLTFPEPMPPEALARMTRIELRPLPGAGDKDVRVLRKDELEVKTIDRPSRSAPAPYVIALREPVPLGMRATLRLQLSLDEEKPESFFEAQFSTAERFRVVSLGCPGRRFPITPQGTKYQEDQAIRCSSDARAIEVELSAEPAALGVVEARNFVRFSPQVDNIQLEVSGRILTLAGDLDLDRAYRITLHPVPLKDPRGRVLEMHAASEVFVYFPRRPSFLQLSAAHGVLERFGPKQIPLEARGFNRVDLRLFSVDPLDLDYWPFGSTPIAVNEAERPPAPGEELDPHHHEHGADPGHIAQHLRELGAPPISRIVELPVGRSRGAASFGLDLAPHLEYLSGKNTPGHYLAGVRRLDGSEERAWMRLQVTDLALTTLETEIREVRFVVTRLSDGSAVPSARVLVEGLRDGRRVELFQATTDANGFATWSQPQGTSAILRLVVSHEKDVLVLDASDAPELYSAGGWRSNAGATWLQWTQQMNPGDDTPAQALCHVYSERPVYRPEESVFLSGWIREREAGRIKNRYAKQDQFRLLINGPGGLEYSVPLQLGALGGFYYELKKEEMPTGEFSVRVENQKPGRPQLFCSTAFRMEAYRIPTFEVRLHGPEQAPLDKTLSIGLTGAYYAGGPLSQASVRWRVTQYPYTWSPPAPRDGFQYSTDARWSRRPRFESTAGLAREGTTDEQGSATLALDPSAEPTAQPRTYVVEATVTGEDEQTVTATHRTNVVPSFVLGLKVPRFLERAKQIEPEIISAGIKGELIAGTAVTVRLVHRAWHSHLLASDFTQGSAKYVTDVVEEKIHEAKVTTKSDGPVKLSLPIPEAGVYVVELEARDSLGRAQVVAVDLYAGGERPVAWAKPQNSVFTVNTDKPSYDPGDTATFVLESPTPKARALAIVEGPEGNKYSWIDIDNGTGIFKLAVESNHVPNLPVHFVLLRGRTKAAGDGKLDLGKPSALAATKNIAVNPVEHRLDVGLKYPKKARPGDEIEVEISLKKRGQRAVAGEVDLWLVDQAVLALGTEQRLDPLPAFITEYHSRFALHDTRSSVFGQLPINENPGGDGNGEEGSNLLDRTTVRKKFLSVPYFGSAIKVGANGKTTVKIQLPDNLTNFLVRAKAVSGEDKFGFATGSIAVRLPLVVQPALPRFARFGDQVEGGAIARVVEGSSGEAKVAVKVEGTKLDRPPPAKINLVKQEPARFDFRFAVPVLNRPEPDRDPTIAVTAGVERSSDGARDAVKIELPVKPDIWPESTREMATFDDKNPLVVKPLPEEARPGSVRRTVLISERDSLIRMASGLDFLLDYPYGSTEQRISKAHTFLALAEFRKTLHFEGNEKYTKRAIEDALAWLPQVTTEHGLVSAWPGSTGYVALTGWVVEFLVAAKKAGIKIDDKLFGRYLSALEQAVRSDYSYFLSGAIWYERVVALRALHTAGRYKAGDAAELARKSNYLSLESTAAVSRIFSENGQRSSSTVRELDEKLWDGVIIRLHQGREIYGGLQDRHGPLPGLVLPSETRTLAEMARAFDAAKDDSKHLELLYDALITLGRGDGWGTTNANASALLALAQRVKSDAAKTRAANITVEAGGKKVVLELDEENPVLFFETAASGEIRVSSDAGHRLTARVENDWIPVTGGKRAKAESKGFVLTRELTRLAETAVVEQYNLEAPLSLSTGDVVEDHVVLVSPADRNYVAITVPLAAGLEPLNPNLETSPPEAQPSSPLTRPPAYSTYYDDAVTYYYDSLPKGTYHFYFRARATTPGSYTQPPAFAEQMYDRTVRGRSPGTLIEVKKR